MKRIAILAALVALSACSATQQAAVDSVAKKAVADGQLFCAKATATGPLIVAVADAAGAPVIVTGATSAFVAGVCRGIGAIPVAPPPAPAAAPVVSVPVAVAPAPVPMAANEKLAT